MWWRDERVEAAHNSDEATHEGKKKIDEREHGETPVKKKGCR